MISMPQIQSIRSRRRNGESIASIARSERVSEPTVRKYVLLQCLFDRFGSVFPQCGLMVFPGVVIVSR